MNFPPLKHALGATWLALSGLFAATCLHAEEAAPTGREQLDEFANELVSMSASFSQMTLDADGFVIDTAEGEVFFQAPNQFRWRYLEPFPMDIVADGERLWHYDEALDQVTVRDQPAASDSPLLVLSQPELLDRFYRQEPSSRANVIRFRPLTDDGEFEYATLEFYQGAPVLLELFDRFQQVTRLELSNLERNPPLDSALFEFEVPDGADLLEGFGD